MKVFCCLLLLLASLASFGSTPTVPATNLHFSAIDGGYVNMGWTAGNGTRRVIICRAGEPVSFIPQNGTDYAENTQFGNGQQVAPGEYVIYDNAFTSFFLTGLSASTQYFFAIFEYNGTGSSTEYLTANFLSGSVTTASTPTVQTSNASFTNITTNSVNLNWTKGNGGRRLIVVREGSPVDGEPVNGQPYNVNSAYGSGATVGSGNFTVYNSSGSATVVTNLKAGTTYFFSFFEFNGSSQPQYLTPSYASSVTTRSVPTIPATNLQITKTDGRELSLNWTNGNGQRRIIVAKQGSDISSSPVNGTDYNVTGIFGSGDQLSNGEYVVYDDNFNEATIGGLDPNTIYYFRIYEYDGSGASTMYLLNSFAAVNGPTAATPSTQATDVSATNIQSSSLSLRFTPGNGRARLIVGRKSGPVNVQPVNFTSYIANSDFGSGQDLGAGNFVLGATTEQSLNIHQLESNSTYHFAIFEFNGYDQPLYLNPGASFSATTHSALPVTLTSWEADATAGKVNLRWTTGSEFNASHFIIEKSKDGNQYSAIATVAASGNSSTGTSYVADDPAPGAGRSYYRLKMVDIDGKFELSPTRVVVLSSRVSLLLIENPVRNELRFAVTGNTNGGKVTWSIVSLSGQTIRKGNTNGSGAGIDISALSASTYWLLVSINGSLETRQFVKM